MNAYQRLQYDQMLCNAYDDMTVLVFKTPGVLQLLRGVKLISKCGYQSATRCSNSLHMHLDLVEC